VPLIKQSQLNGDKVDLTKCVYLDESFLESKKDFVLKKGDVLIGMSGSVGKMCLYDLDFPALQNQRTGKAVPYSETLLNKKLFWYFLSTIERILLEKGKGLGVANVSADDIEDLVFYLPPLAEQHRIVAKLDAIMQKVESNKLRLDKIPKLLKRFRQSVLAAAVNGKLSEEWRAKNGSLDAKELIDKIQAYRKDWAAKEIKKGNGEAKRIISKLSKHSFDYHEDIIPSSWTYSSLLKACHLVVDCHNKTAPYVDEGIYLVRTTNIKEGKIILEDIRYVTQKTYEYWSKRSIPSEGDIIFTREAPMGEAAIIPKGMKVCLGQRTMLLKMPNGLLNNNYLLYCLMAPKMTEQINEKAIGSGVKHLRVGDVESLFVPIPPLEEQKEIIRRVEQLFAFADKLEARYTKAKTMLDKLPQSILSKAFRGELVAQDPNDEPASVLLERIKREEEKLFAEKKGKKLKEYSIDEKPLKIAAEKKVKYKKAK
jgi:type I restriction enzyme S subunit